MRTRAGSRRKIAGAGRAARCERQAEAGFARGKRHDHCGRETGLGRRRLDRSTVPGRGLELLEQLGVIGRIAGRHPLGDVGRRCRLEQRCQVPDPTTPSAQLSLRVLLG
jgi:hypothetical protein